jgi:hypothetical protein
MATLTGNKPKDTYKGLIKTIDSNEVSGDIQLSDGNGNALPITVSTTEVRVNGEALTSFKHYQTTTSAEWIITHNMGKYPSVSVVDSANSYVIGEVEYIDENVLIVRFKNPFKGNAFLN